MTVGGHLVRGEGSQGVVSEGAYKKGGRGGQERKGTELGTDSQKQQGGEDQPSFCQPDLPVIYKMEEKLPQMSQVGFSLFTIYF